MSRFGLLFFGVALFGGCSWLNATLHQQGKPDTRIVLAPMQHMEFSQITQRNRIGQHIDEYRCEGNRVMVCESFGASWDCSCGADGRF